MKFNFTGKTALVTGAGAGIGKAVSIMFAQNGAKVVLVDVDTEKLESVKKEIQEYTKDVIAVKCDIGNKAEIDEAVKKAEEAFGGVDILINNAAIWRCWSTVLDTPIEEWRRYFDINVFGTVNFIKAVLPKMIEKGYGKIVNVSSVAGVYGNANMAHYSATKGAVISLTKALAKEVIDKGIYVNCVSPGTVSPEMDTASPNELSYLGRQGTSNENAGLICFLASDDASYIVGQNIQIDGGRKKI